MTTNPPPFVAGSPPRNYAEDSLSEFSSTLIIIRSISIGRSNARESTAVSRSGRREKRSSSQTGMKKIHVDPLIKVAPLPATRLHLLFIMLWLFYAAFIRTCPTTDTRFGGTEYLGSSRIEREGAIQYFFFIFSSSFTNPFTNPPERGRSFEYLRG